MKKTILNLLALFYCINVLSSIYCMEDMQDQNTNVNPNVSNINLEQITAITNINSGIFACNKPGCNFQTDNIDAFTAHKKEHIREILADDLTCKKCAIKFESWHGCFRHMLSYHPEITLFNCHICGYSTNDQYNLGCHLNKIHNEKKGFPCIFCSILYSKQRTFVDHILASHIKNYSYKCNYPPCSFSSDEIKKLKEHLSKHSGVKFKCDTCGFTDIINEVKLHMIEKHSIVPIKCPHKTCEFVDIAQLSLDIHIRLEHNNALKEEDLDLLVDYSKSFSEDEAGKFKCNTPNCSYLAKNDSNRSRLKYRLKYHKLAHLGLKPYCCRECNFASNHREQFANHNRERHQNGADLIIKIGRPLDVEKKVRIRNIINQMEKADEQFLACDCGLIFGSRRNLLLHKSHHDSPVYKCPLCNVNYLTKYSRDRHKKDCQSIVETAPTKKISDINAQEKNQEESVDTSWVDECLNLDEFQNAVLNGDDLSEFFTDFEALQEIREFLCCDSVQGNIEEPVATSEIIETGLASEREAKIDELSQYATDQWLGLNSEFIANYEEILKLFEALSALASDNQEKLNGNTSQILEILKSIKIKLLQLLSDKLLSSVLGSFVEADSLANKLSLLVDNVINKINNLDLKFLVLEIQEIIHRTIGEEVLEQRRKITTVPEAETLCIANLNRGQVIQNENANKVDESGTKRKRKSNKEEETTGPVLGELLKCNIKNCGKLFTRIQSLNKHKKDHIRKLYECDLCGASFLRKQTINSHKCKGASINSFGKNVESVSQVTTSVNVDLSTNNPSESQNKMQDLGINQRRFNHQAMASFWRFQGAPGIAAIGLIQPVRALDLSNENVNANVFC